MYMNAMNNFSGGLFDHIPSEQVERCVCPMVRKYRIQDIKKILDLLPNSSFLSPRLKKPQRHP